MNIKLFLRRFNITILCLMAVHILLTQILGFLIYALFFRWEWYLQLYVIGFVCEQLYTAATEQEAKPVKRMRILSVIFAVCSSVHIQLGGTLSYYIIPLVCIWSLRLWMEAHKMDPEKKIQNTVNCVLTVIYVLHAAVDILLRYADGRAHGYLHPIAFIASRAMWMLGDYLPWGILINMVFLAVRAYRNMSDD